MRMLAAMATATLVAGTARRKSNAKDKATLAKLKSAEGGAFDKVYVSAQLTAPQRGRFSLPHLCQEGRTGTA